MRERKFGAEFAQWQVDTEIYEYDYEEWLENELKTCRASVSRSVADSAALANLAHKLMESSRDDGYGEVIINAGEFYEVVNKLKASALPSGKQHTHGAEDEQICPHCKGSGGYVTSEDGDCEPCIPCEGTGKLHHA